MKPWFRRHLVHKCSSQLHQSKWGLLVRQISGYHRTTWAGFWNRYRISSCPCTFVVASFTNVTFSNSRPRIAFAENFLFLELNFIAERSLFFYRIKKYFRIIKLWVFKVVKYLIPRPVMSPVSIGNPMGNVFLRFRLLLDYLLKLNS